MREPFTPAFFHQLQSLKIRTRRSFLGSRQGAHLSLRRGHGLEFSDFRQYTAGDDFRHIDWGVYGRTDRLYIRRFQEEQDLNVILLLDTSLSMGFPEGESKFETARDLAIALGYIALTDGDTICMSYLGQRLSQRYSGPRALSRVISDAGEFHPTASFNFVNEVRASLARQHTPGKCFLISDFLFDFSEQVRTIDFIKSRNFDLSVIQVLAPGELQLNVDELEYVEDAETGELIELALDNRSKEEYARLLSKHVAQLEEYCHKNAIAHVLLSSDIPIAQSIVSRFTELGIVA